MFEQEYKRANDRIHPRKDLLKELEKQWAAEAEQPPEEEPDKVVRFPGWIRYAGMAAGILLCVGVGMGSVMLLTRDRGDTMRSAKAEAPMAMDTAMEGEAVLYAAAPQAEEKTNTTAFGMLMEAAAQEPPQGMHPAADEGEVLAALQGGAADGDMGNRAEPKGEAAIEDAAAATEPPLSTAAPTPAAKAAAATVQEAYGAGALMQRDDLVAVYMPTAERVQVYQHEAKKMTAVFALTLRERDARVKQVFWMGNEFLAVREREGDTELLHFDVADWSTPKHLRDLTQSGAFLGAGEVNGQLAVLSLYRAEEEEPLPRVDGTQMDFAHVLLDSERPGDVYTVLTIYDPGQDAFVAQTALLEACCGAAFAEDGLLLWTAGEEPALYRFAWGAEGLHLAAEATAQGSVLSAGITSVGFELLTQAGASATVTIYDETLGEMAASTHEAGAVRRAEIYEDGVVYLTSDALCQERASGDGASFTFRSLPLAGDAFRRLSKDRLLVISASGELRLVALDREELEVLGTIEVKDDLALLAEDPSRLDYEPDTGRLAFPAGQKVYQFRVAEAEDFPAHGVSLNFADHREAEQRELRCLLMSEETLIFTKDGVVLCNANLVRQRTVKY